MKVRRLDKDHDILLGRGAYTHLENNPECVGQVIFQRFKLDLGEWWLNVQDGMDDIMGRVSINAIDSVVRSRILETESVLRITAFASRQDTLTRTYFANITVETLYGEITQEVALG